MEPVRQSPRANPELLWRLAAAELRLTWTGEGARPHTSMPTRAGYSNGESASLLFFSLKQIVAASVLCHLLRHFQERSSRVRQR